jgi:hypothetical protein
MADYYPLISRAVVGLEKNSGENRRALYERARAALLAQLRGIEPALSESDITRERLALEESIRKVEAECARKFVEPTKGPPSPKIRPIEPRRREEEPAAPPPRREPVAPPPRRAAPTPAIEAPKSREIEREERIEGARRDEPRLPRMPSTPPFKPVLPSTRPAAPVPAAPPRRTAPVIAEQVSVPRPPPLPVAPLRRPFSERSPLGEADRAEARSLALPEDDLASFRPEKASRIDEDALAPPFAERRRAQAGELKQLDRPEPRLLERTPRERMFDRQDQSADEAHDEAHPHADFSQPMLESSFPLDDAEIADSDAEHSVAEDEEQADRESILQRVLAWRPSPALLKGATGGAAAIVVFGLLYWTWPNMVSVYRAWRAPAMEAAREAPAPAAARTKIVDRLEPGAQSTSAVPTAISPTPAVAQKVVLYEEDPVDPNGKRFVGSAIWRTEMVSPGPGQPQELAIRADIEVPERKLAMTWSLRRNTDKGLPASHTVEIVFKTAADFPSGGISNVPGILMKQAEQTRGVPLAGLAVKVTNGFFLIGLSNVDADKDRNLSLLRERGWFDIPVVYNNNRRAILAIEKGTPGERAFAEAFKIWRQ